MEECNEGIGMLDLLIRPGFCVKEHRIEKVNQAAQGLLISPGTDVRTLLLTGQEEYASFQGGCLYVMLNLSPSGCGAAVTRVDGWDVFLLNQKEDEQELRSLALAALELREPLSNVLAVSRELYDRSEDLTPTRQEQTARLNRGLYQMLRIVGNMSDALRCTQVFHPEVQNIDKVFREILDKSQTLVAHAGIRLTYQGLSEEILCLADAQQLERALLNILSNAVKFTPQGGTIAVSLTRHRQMLWLQVLDSGSGIAQTVLHSIYHRYLRQPTLEDLRWGIGLGMVLIRAAAANHGGTVLIDQPEGAGTRITMTLPIRQDTGDILRSPVFRVDYAGELDHTLIELSDCLPASAFPLE